MFRARIMELGRKHKGLAQGLMAGNVQMLGFDVGGSHKSQQSGYEVFGIQNQARVVSDGVDHTEGVGGTGFYEDYYANEEVAVGSLGSEGSMQRGGHSMALDKQALIDGLNSDLAGEYAAIIQYTHYAATVTGPFRESLRTMFRWLSETTFQTSTPSRVRSRALSSTAAMKLPWLPRSHSTSIIRPTSRAHSPPAFTPRRCGRRRAG